MLEIAIIVFSVIGFLTFVLWQARRQSIVNIPGRNRHFGLLARKLEFQLKGDDYFIQLEGMWNDVPIIIYPHNFEGPGLITLFYADTGAPYVDRSWVEPYLSLGRALVERQRGYQSQFEFAGNPNLKNYGIVEVLNRYREQYPYLAITLPERFAYSQHLLASVSEIKNYIAFLVMDSGKRPSMDEVEEALDAITDIAKTVKSVLSQ